MQPRARRASTSTSSGTRDPIAFDRPTAPRNATGWWSSNASTTPRTSSAPHQDNPPTWLSPRSSGARSPLRDVLEQLGHRIHLGAADTCTDPVELAAIPETAAAKLDVRH